MKVKELVEILREFNPEARVLVSGYEYNFDDPAQVTSLKVVRDADDESLRWAGRYSPWEEGDEGEPFEAVLIPR